MIKKLLILWKLEINKTTLEDLKTVDGTHSQFTYNKKWYLS